jgi:sugar lactone lactonase YvrE
MKNSPHTTLLNTHPSLRLLSQEISQEIQGRHPRRSCRPRQVRAGWLGVWALLVLAAALGLGWKTWRTVSAQQALFNISTVAGSSGGSGLTAELRNARGVAAASATVFYIADTGNHVIRRVDTQANSITIVAGNGSASTNSTDANGDGGPATNATLREPYDVVVDQAGNLYISDTGNRKIRKVAVSDGTIQTIIGNGSAGVSDGAASGPVLSEPRGMTLNGDTLYITDSGSHRVLEVNGLAALTPETAPLTLVTGVAGNGFAGADGDGGPAATANLNGPRDVAVSGNNLYIADTGNHKIRRVTKNGQNINMIDTFAGTGVPGSSGEQGQALTSQLNAPFSVAADATSVYIADSSNNRLRQVQILDGFMSTVAGNGQQGFTGDGTPATSFALNAPSGIIVANNTLVFVDTGNRRLRRLAGSTLSTIVSDGSGGFSGDGGPATQAKLDSPSQVIVDNSGNWYIADTNNHVIRKVGTDGKISTIAGLPGMMSASPTALNGDGEDATLATLSFPSSLALDAGGNLFIADTGNRRIRRVGLDGKITTVAGVVGQGAVSILGALSQPTSIALDSLNNLYIADPGQHVVFAQNSLGSARNFIAGMANSPGSSGDGGNAEKARLNRPTGLTVVNNTIYIADTNNHRVRKVEKVNDVWQISSAVPLSSSTVQIIPRPGYEGDNLPVNGATRLTLPTGVAADTAGTLYIVDRGNNRVRRVDAVTRVITTIAGNGDIGFGGDGGPATAAALGLPLSITLVPNTNPVRLLLADTGNNRLRQLIEPENLAPALINPGNKTVNEGIALSFTLAASDPNAGQTLTYSMSSTPPLPTEPAANAALLNAATGAFSFTPGFDVAPNQPNGQTVFNVTLTATDNGNPQKTDSETITITVNNVNGKPTVDSGTIPATVEATGPSGASVPLTAMATDPDNDPMTFLWTNTRPGQQPQTIGTQLSINPTLALGQHFIIFTATDNSNNSASTAPKSLIVQDTTKPAFNPATLPDITETITSGNSKVVNFTLPTATDLVSGPRTVTAQPASGSTFPVGMTTVTVSASDAAGNIAQLTFKVTLTCVGTNCSGSGGGDPNATNYNISALAGTGSFGTSGDNGNATAALLKEPRGLAVDLTGNIYIADQEAHTIRRVSTQGVISLFAGTGVKGFAGDNGVATSARFNSPTGLAIDATRNILYVADTGNHRLRRIDLSNNIITTFAGTGLAGLNADGAATSTQLNSPGAVAVDGGGAVYIADTGNNRIVRVSNGNAATFAGNGQVGNTGDSGAPAQAKFNHPTGVAVTSDGTTVYVADRGNNRVRKIVGGVITNFAGNGNAATSGDGALATAAGLNAPTDVMVDATGIVYLSETDGERLRRVATDGKIDTLAGTGVAGNTGDEGAATSATLNTPTALARNTSTGMIFFCDTGNLRVRRLVPSGSTNRPPVPQAVGNALLPKTQSLNLPLSATDADGDSVTFTLVPALSFVSIVSPDPAARSATLFINPAGGNAGLYTVRVQATDSKGGTGFTPEFTITVTDPNNNPPVAVMNTLSATIFAPSGSTTATVNLNGAGSSDPDGDAITSYAWFDGATQIATGQVTTAQLGAGQHAIRLVVTDSRGASGSSAIQNVTVQLVTTGNRAPTARIKNLPPEVFAANGVDTQVLLDGSDSTDPDGDVLTYEWFNGASKIATGVTATVTLPVGTHQIKLVVNDGTSSAETEPQEVRVSVTPPEIEVTSVSPSTGRRGQTITVTVNGRGFNATSYVTLNGGGVTVTTTFVSSTQLIARLVISNAALTGQRGVTVTNPSGGSATRSNAFRIDP